MKIWRVEITRVTKYQGIIITEGDERPGFASRAELGSYVDNDTSVRLVSQYTDVDNTTELIDKPPFD